MTPSQSPAQPSRLARQAIPSVQRVLAVSSGKGGVGKSTTAMNLALALADEGWRVGLLDADIYGPSVPMMMGVGGVQPQSGDEGRLLHPVLAHGIQLMSIGFLSDEHSPIIWRGAAASQMLVQLMWQTAWDNLDCLVVDMPPGTGDVPMTLCQRAPLNGALIVTTPQDVALLDVIKGVQLFQKADVPVLGAIENMAVHLCDHCGHASHPFGQGVAQRLWDDVGVRVLASLPLERRLREQADAGVPVVRSHPDSEMAGRYREIARTVRVMLDASLTVGPAGLNIRVSTDT